MIGDKLNINSVKRESLRLTRLCTNMPGALVEVLYLSSPEEEMMALDPAFVDKIAEGLSRGIFLLMRDRGNGLDSTLNMKK
jgi:N-acetylmuramoyl-L-alanine amidase